MILVRAWDHAQG